MYAKVLFPIPIEHYLELEALIQGRMDRYFHVNFAKFWLNPTVWIWQQKLRLIRLSNIFLIFYCPNFVIIANSSSSFFPLTDRSDSALCSDAVAHLLQGSVCCTFKDVLLYSSIIKSTYLISCCFSISLNLSDHSCRMSCINKVFLSTELLLPEIFFSHFSVNRRDNCAGKSL